MFILVASILKMTSRSYEGSHDLVGQTNRVLTMAHIWGMVKINPPGIGPKVVHVSHLPGQPIVGLATIFDPLPYVCWWKASESSDFRLDLLHQKAPTWQNGCLVFP